MFFGIEEKLNHFLHNRIKQTFGLSFYDFSFFAVFSRYTMFCNIFIVLLICIGLAFAKVDDNALNKYVEEDLMANEMYF